MAMKLYFIHAYDVNGDSLDQFIVATDPEDAKNLWLVAGLGFGADHDPEHDLLQVQEVPTAKHRGVIQWDDIVEHSVERKVKL